MKTFFDELYENYHHDLFQYLIYMVKDRDLVEDLVQDVYIKVLKSYQSFDGRSTEKTWLLSIARHVAIDYFRKQKRKRNRIMGFFDWNEKGEQLKDHSSLPDEIAVQNDEMKQVYKALDNCTLDQRNVIIFRFIQGMSIQETAEILNWSESKVKTTQHRGMKSLKEMMDKPMEGGVQREA
ncbi:RNA polymerase, sigma subunit, SigX [Halobacillus alkaliphilus]|uniref:RNA polymerase sigma factor n=1 Tax=Halobacillus alkaliphilus TaxID=396056 RepID=A0A1I2K7X3_9BACI|nr:RNA polymerase sigma factor SigX [Halobacillus alkaliphilus]SFF62419.1 RNA polymerase, sigma subunit, SigX [Halobacillus alkaliphilus]